EASKSGVAPKEAAALADQVRTLPGLELVGLMCLPPLNPEAERSRPYFRDVAALAKQLGLRELSMGSTHDYEVAIEEGATWVRVGSALFGERPSREGTAPLKSL